ncbi:hypothetical protein [Pedobacter alpinus]|uniref:GLPGLI family protein n=1 Tax=Pedobacter alpinus TaxID=1590643 RepID=A0ABW5TTL5_9SPHI
MNKYLLKTLLIFAFAIALKTATAQVPAAYQGSYNRMMSQQNLIMANRNMMNMMMNRNWLNNANYLNNPIYDFKVTGLDDSVKTIRSKIYTDTTLHKTYLLTVNKKLPKNAAGRETRTYVNETKSISRESPYEGLTTGLATDSCWQFKVISGKINAYSFLSETSYISTYNLSAFQLGDGLIQAFNTKELEKIISFNKRAKKAFDKKDYYKAILLFNRE